LGRAQGRETGRGPSRKRAYNKGSRFREADFGRNSVFQPVEMAELPL
jgi:hypothetical protein